jgi:hypothetical protein
VGEEIMKMTFSGAIHEAIVPPTLGVLSRQVESQGSRVKSVAQPVRFTICLDSSPLTLHSLGTWVKSAHPQTQRRLSTSVYWEVGRRGRPIP